jgi:hypothetical protein
LVSHYLTNKLISRKLLFRRKSISLESIWGISNRFQLLSPS